MGILVKLEAALQGKKTYIIGVLIGVAAVLGYYQIEIPAYVWQILGALGLGAVRSAIEKSK